MPPLFDMHTHSPAFSSGAVRLLNIHSSFQRVTDAPPVSIGMHPWYIHADRAFQEFQELEATAAGPEVLAVGECGLDRLCETPMPLQGLWFRRQLSLAEKLRKPIIVHCVRAYDEVLQAITEERVTVPVIFHGFRKDRKLSERILSAGYMLSFGHHLSQPAVGEVFRSIPIERVFLETDDAPVGIDAVYASAASLRGMTFGSLVSSVWATAVSVFGEILTTYE